MTYEPMLVPDRKPNRTTRTVLIVVAAVLAVCCVVGVGGGFWLFRTVNTAVGPAREATGAYLDDVQAGNYQGAYGRLCERVRDGMPQEEFTRVQSAQLKISSYKITGVSVSNYNGRVSGVVTVQLVQVAGGRFTQTIPLTKERGEWRVCQ
ncbi:DUF4878 domain-containing protein [Micromonospora sp. RHAY321]|uniref:Rv0361 family membrane protein n=1 Tax=Micromonospora sp. RHAY321 TaxID=2944807 RepID=UPI00207CAFF8|nr:DUF4878 domain-containing protein [Micromonospora sp. RHAY321]MCO1597035.1 DUF4878 domain-containing protein [Micromonospora sp. RHAY321]